MKHFPSFIRFRLWGGKGGMEVGWEGWGGGRVKGCDGLGVCVRDVG